MNGFISQLVSRHTEPIYNIAPRIPGKFEPETFSLKNSFDTSHEEHVSVNTSHEIESFRQSVQHAKPIVFFRSVNERLNHVEPLAAEKSLFQAPSLPQENVMGKTHIESAEEKPISQKIRSASSESFEIQEPIDENASPSITTKEDHRSKRSDQPEIKSSRIIQEVIKPVIKKEKSRGQESETTNAIVQQPSFVSPAILNPDIRSYRVDPPEKQSSTPAVIKVSIGRIDVRAISQNPVKKNGTVLQKPQMSLDEYLKKRNIE